MYQIEKRKFGVHDEYLIFNGLTGESATITVLGANVRDLELSTEQGRPLFWNGSHYTFSRVFPLSVLSGQLRRSWSGCVRTGAWL